MGIAKKNNMYGVWILLGDSHTSHLTLSTCFSAKPLPIYNMVFIDQPWVISIIILVWQCLGKLRVDEIHTQLFQTLSNTAYTFA